MTVIDFFSEHDTAFYNCVALEGIVGIARYLTNSPTDSRQITRSEVADAHAAGLAIHFAYEMSPTYANYFTFAQGAEDCRNAIDRLQELGAPAGTVVYFAVDVNIEPSITTEYFNGVESMQTPAITPGVYGYQRMCEYARANYPNLGRHLWQTYGTQTGPLDLYQNYQDVLCGVEVDWNDSYVEGWTEVTGDQVKDLIREMLKSPEGAALVTEAIGNDYGPRLETELAQRLHDERDAATVQTLLQVKDECLKPKP